MRAITVQQPWAWAIIHGGKCIENRTRIGTWCPAVGQRIAIHAGQRWSERGAADLRVLDAGRPHRDRTMFGAIIGTVEVADVHPEHGGCCQPWGEASYTDHDGTKRVDIVHLVLENPRPCEPIPCRGALGLWSVPDDIAARLA